LRTYHFPSWRRIKKDFLHHFHKPRLDLLVWILVVKLAPTYYRKLDQFQDNMGRYRELASWRRQFKRKWKELEGTPITAPVNPKYRPDPRRWVCTCPYFSTSRFLICKHLIQAVHPVPPLFFVEAKRNRTTPFWHHPSLVPLDAGPDEQTEGNVPIASTEESRIDDGGDESDDELIDTAHGWTAADNGTFRERMTTRIKMLRDFCDGLEHQLQFEDQRMLAAVEREGAAFFRFADNCLSRERRFNSTRSTSPTTWEKTTTSAMYYRSRPRLSDVDT
jgi:hypothetical protein